LREKGYTAPEMKLILDLAGFEMSHVWSSHAPNWRRMPPQPDEIGMLIIAHKRK
jgi:hypothetical protein